jgi:hypothetical protein
MKARLTNKYPVADRAGRGLELLEFTVFDEVPASYGSSPREAEVTKDLRLADGRHVNVLEKGRYQVVESGEILTSSDANAPEP